MTAPAISVPTETAFDPSAAFALDSIVSSAVSETIAEQSAPAKPLPPRAPDGKFAKAEGTGPEDGGEELIDQSPTDGAPSEPQEAVPESAEAEAEDAPLVLPEGLVHVPAIEGRELATQFTVLDSEGELEPPNLTIKFVANGKERTEPLDKVVALAQMGVYNHAREQSAQQARTEAQQAKTRAERAEQEIARVIQYAESLLSSDDAYLAARAQYDQANTPEARLQRDRQQVEQERQLVQVQTAAAEASQFYDRSIVPAVDTLVNSLPSVSLEEVGAKLLLLIQPYQVQTVIGPLVPPAAFGAVKQAILSDLLPWAQQLHDDREASRRQSATASASEKRASEEAARRAQVEAQKKTALVGKATGPARGRVAGTSTPPPKKLVTVDDHMEDAIQSSVRAALAG